MKIVKLLGGLGNQMFQYAFSMELERRCGEKVFLDVGHFEDYELHNGLEIDRVFGVGLALAPEKDIARLATSPRGIAGRLRRKYLTKPGHYIDRSFGFTPEVFALEGDRYFEGYWQSEKYFESTAEEVREALRFKPPLDARNRDFLESLPRPACSVHARRGDYLLSRNLNVCGKAYYENAIALASREAGIASYAVFSDDIEWCRSSLDFGATEARFVDWNRGGESWQDMAMMADCEHHIIANSSFSWWAAWLGASGDSKVIAPSVWNMRQLETRDPYYRFSFDDIVPARWLRAGIR